MSLAARPLLTVAGSTRADAFPGSLAPDDDDGRGFLTLDALLRRPDASGLVFVHGTEGLLEAVAAHAARRARGAGRAVLSVGRCPTDDPLRELCAQASGSASAEPFAAAESIAKGLAGTVAVVLDRSPGTWGNAVLDALAASLPEGPGAPLIIIVSPARRRPGSISIRGALGPEETRAFWEAIALDADRTLSPRLQRLDALERWWGAARGLRDGEEPSPLSAAARRLLARIALSERAWHPADLVRLGPAAARDELLVAGAIEVGARGQAVSLASAPVDAGAADTADVIAVAEALDKGVASYSGEPRHEVDPWASLRAAELFARAGDGDRAEAAAARAILTVADADARADFWQRWQRAQALLADSGAAPRLLRSAELALRTGDADRALEMARAAAPRAESTYEATLILGRAMAARGDLTTAALALGRAMEMSGGVAERARAAVEIAEVHYNTGQIDEARRAAEQALAGAGDASTRLKARNVLGKLLLDKARWAEAEVHFAADAWEAACSGDSVGELRARLNRAIALMSDERHDEARTMLAGVHADGEAQGQLRAVCFALANLAIIALWKHEYAEALGLSERSITFARRVGDKFFLAHLITNLAEVRLLFGLVAEAEQALAFGRKACGAVVVSKLASHFALVAARIHLERGRTLEAAAEIRSALSTAETSPSGRLGRCLRVAARIALEDGDVARASEVMERARQTSTNTKDRSETLVLEAMLHRALGQPYSEPAAEALALAGQTDNRAVALEAHVLLCQAAIARSDMGAARSHLGSAIALRNRTAGALPEEIRHRYLELRELRELAGLKDALERADLAMGPMTLRSGLEQCDLLPELGAPPPRPSSSSPPASDAGMSAAPQPGSRKIVGRDASIAALLAAVNKLGPSDDTVLIHGESGTGKELVAEAIHQASRRRGGPLVKVNCAALVETLLLSELFGHEKGAFTGAVARRRGRFELAEGGTLFLDEIGDISPGTQVALLRVLQEKAFERVGGVTPIRANVRVVCATHRDLTEMVARGEFRKDLYFRLAGMILEVPPLRQRLSDIPLIAEAILARVGAERGAAPKRLSPPALRALLSHRWPGNVRELENALRAASLFAEGDVIEVSDLIANVESLRGIDLQAEAAAREEAAAVSIPHDRPSGIRATAPPSAPGDAPFRTGAAGSAITGVDGTVIAGNDTAAVEAHADPSRNAQGQACASDPTDAVYVHIRSGVSLPDLKRNIERECIQRALTESKGNITRAAALLGMKRPRLSQLVKQYGFGGVSEMPDGSEISEEES